MLSSGTDATGEHEIKLLRLAYLIPSVGICDLVLLAKLAELGTSVVVQLGVIHAIIRQNQNHVPDGNEKERDE